MGNIYSTVPYNAQISKLALPMSCVTQFCYPPDTTSCGSEPQYNTNTTILLEISTTAPINAGSGQNVYFSDITANLLLDQSFAVTPSDYNAWYISNTDITFNTTNAAPQQLIINDTAPRSSQPVTRFRFLLPGTTSYAPLGPLTLVQANTSDLSVSQFAFDLTTVHGVGSYSSRRSTCTPDDAANILTTISQSGEGSGEPALQISNGANSSFPPLSNSTKFTRVNLPVVCEGLMENNLNFTIQGITPASVSASEAFNITDVVAFLTLPPSLVSAYSAGTADPVDISLQLVSFPTDSHGSLPGGLTLIATNAEPGVYDANSPSSIAQSQVNQDPNLNSQRLVYANASIPLPMPIPVSGYLVLGPFTANEGVSEVSFSFGEIDGIVYSSDGQNSSFSCSDLNAGAYFSVPVVNP